MTEPICRACYAATLTPDERDRFNAEPPTSSVYLCPDHQASIDQALARLNAVFSIGPRDMFPDPPRVTPPVHPHICRHGKTRDEHWCDDHDDHATPPGASS